MMTKWQLEPEVPAELGDETEMDTSYHPPRVARLHLRFAGWLGDDLIECFPCFAVSSELGRALEEAGLSGFKLEDLTITTAPELNQLQPGVALPEFRRLMLQATDANADFQTDAEHRLVVSERAMDVLRRFSIANCTAEKC